MDIKATLERGLSALSLDLNAASQGKLLDYLALLEKWGRTYNLTAVRERQSMVGWHLLDSLAVLPYVRGPRLIDVGTGAGLPGIPLAIARPELSVCLLDSQHKRARFLVHAAHTLDLQNVDVVHERAQQYRPERKFDTLVARAFAAIPDLLQTAGHLCCPAHGRIVLMKGRFPDDELASVPDETYTIVDVRALRVPGLDATRHIVIISPVRNRDLSHDHSPLPCNH